MRVRVPGRLRDFVKLRPEVEAVLQHVGRDTWDLVLLSVDGAWIRDEFASPDAAQSVCDALGVRLHQGWDDLRLVRRVGARDQWATRDGQRRAL